MSRWCYPCGRRAGKPRGGRFREAASNWRGGRHVDVNGYVSIVVPLDDPLLSMADSRGRIYEHRLVMARHLGRSLDRIEQVHHRNGDKLDNRLSNLELMSLSEHAAVHGREVDALRRRVQELERELREAAAT